MPYRIEIAGSIAAGKSTLCDALEKCGFEIIRERLDENIYLGRTYANRASRGYDVQMAFLLSKASAIETYEGSAPVIVCDYAMVVEYAYTQMHLRGVDGDAYRLCMDSVGLKRRHIGDPDLLIHVSCPPDVQMDRIRQRGRAFEQSLTLDYLKELNGLIETHVMHRPGPGTATMSINSHARDLRDPAVIDDIILSIRQHVQAGPAGSAQAQPVPRP